MSTQVGFGVGFDFGVTGKLGLNINSKSTEMLENITKILEEEKRV